MRWILLFVGGGVGTVLRALASAWIQTASSPPPGSEGEGGFPYGILAVNLLGCLLIGGLFALDDARGALGESGRLLLLTGLLGGFTTYSAFGLDLWRLIAAGQPGVALSYAALSLIGGLLAVALGVISVRAMA